MKILLVSNQYNPEGLANPVINRMQASLIKNDKIDKVEFLPFQNNFKSFKTIRAKVKENDIIHIHFGGLYALSIILSLLFDRTPIFITFHGTDIHAQIIKSTKSIKKKIKIRLNQWASFISIFLTKKSGFVAQEMLEYVPSLVKKINKEKIFINKLGVDYDKFFPIEKNRAKEILNLPDKNYVLFSDISGTSIKRLDIAKEIIDRVDGYELLLIRQVKPEMVPFYINSCEFLILTSDQEGSPNIIRECLACNKTVFSVDVGDARSQLSGLSKSCIISRNADDASNTIQAHLQLPDDDSRKVKENEISQDLIIDKLVEIYFSTLNKSKN